MTVDKQAYLNIFKDKLLAIYQKVVDHGDAPAYDKGIVQGIMITGRAMELVTKEELQHVIDQERLKVFGTTERLVIKQSKKSMDHGTVHSHRRGEERKPSETIRESFRPPTSRGGTERLPDHTKDMLDEESYLDIPTFLRIKLER